MEIPNKPKERLDQIDKVLDEYESSLGLVSYAGDFHDQSVKQYMNMPRQQMEKLTVDECAEAALLLGGFSFYLQSVAYPDHLYKLYLLYETIHPSKPVQLIKDLLNSL